MTSKRQAIALQLVGMGPQQQAMGIEQSQNLLRKGQDTSPVGHWTQALARTVQGGLGGLERRGVADAEMQAAETKRQAMARLLAGNQEEAASLLAGNAGTQDEAWKLAQSVASSRASAASAARAREQALADEERDFARKKELLQFQAELKGGDPDPYVERQRQAASIGLNPSSDAYKRYVLTGQIDKEALTTGATAEDKGANIAAGIDRLAQVPNDFDNWTFESSVGPLQGDENGGIASTIARAAGSIANMLRSQSTTEVRNRIKGDTEALAAAIKPLIRKPGEGAWTDQDQARLVAVVGNLQTARNAEEYGRALEGVRQRVMANFGIQLPPIKSGRPKSSDQETPAMSDGWGIRQIE